MRQFRRPHCFHDKVHHAVAFLYHTPDSDNRRGKQYRPQLLVAALPDDEVYKTGLVLKGHKDGTGGGGWPLSINDHSDIGDALVVSSVGNFPGGGVRASRQPLPMRFQRVCSGTVSGSAIVPGELLKHFQVAERGRVFVHFKQLSGRCTAFRVGGITQCPPYRTSAANTESVKRAGLGEAHRSVTVEAKRRDTIAGFPEPDNSFSIFGAQPFHKPEPDTNRQVRVTVGGVSGWRPRSAAD